MRRLRALLEKELRHHAMAGVALLVSLGGFYVLGLAGTFLSPETVSLMQAHHSFLVMLMLAPVVLGNRLVVAEYYGRTQLFVEALPIRRWEMVALKYVFGFGLIAAAAGLSLAATTLAALSREAIDARFVGIVALRTLAWTFFLWSFFFAMGFVGRFRIPIYLGILLALATLNQVTAFELERFGPVAVLANLPFEREQAPVEALAVTFGLGAGATALAFVLALIHEGSVAESLARRMSQREKAAIGVLFVFLILAMTFFEERRDKEPYSFPDLAVLTSDDSAIEVLYLSDDRLADAEALLGHLERELAALRSELGWDELPQLRIAYSPSLDAGIFDRGELERNEGILVRANFERTERWDPRELGAYVVGLVLDEATEDRARFEPKAWLRDGFAHWWSVRGTSPNAPLDLASLCDPASPLRPHILRAMWTHGAEPLDEDRLRTWRRYRERHGEALAEASALSGLLVLDERAGRSAVMELARAVFGRKPHNDLRELVYEWRRPMSRVFEKATELDWHGFVDEWRAELEQLSARPSCQEALAEAPEGTGSIDVELGTGTVRDIVYQLEFSEPLPEGTLATLVHTRLTPFDDELERHDLRRVERVWPAGARQAIWRLPGFYSQGSRAFLALEIESEALGSRGRSCPIRLHAERRLLP